MKVEDLIKSLQKYNPKAEIGISIDGYYESELYLSHICKDTDGKRTNPTNHQASVDRGNRFLQGL